MPIIMNALPLATYQRPTQTTIQTHTNTHTQRKRKIARMKKTGNNGLAKVD